MNYWHGAFSELLLNLTRFMIITVLNEPTLSVELEKIPMVHGNVTSGSS